jgi:hypothetical protein
MPKSKAALALNQKSVQALKQMATEIPLAVWYDAEKEKFAVAYADDPSLVPLCRARYEVVAAFVQGYAYGYLRGRKDQEQEQSS